MLYSLYLSHHKCSTDQSSEKKSIQQRKIYLLQRSDGVATIGVLTTLAPSVFNFPLSVPRSHGDLVAQPVGFDRPGVRHADVADDELHRAGRGVHGDQVFREGKKSLSVVAVGAYQGNRVHDQVQNGKYGQRLFDDDHHYHLPEYETEVAEGENESADDDSFQSAFYVSVSNA